MKAIKIIKKKYFYFEIYCFYFTIIFFALNFLYILNVYYSVKATKAIIFPYRRLNFLMLKKENHVNLILLETRVLANKI